jgi:TatD DNase family protein
MSITDTHCHLYLKGFKADLAAVIERSVQAGVNKIFLPAIDRETHQDLIDLIKQSSSACEIYPMMGVHPCSIGENFEEELEIARQHLDSGIKFYGVGETGLDYYWDVTHKELQIVAFERQIQWGIDRNLPVIIHSRNSTPDCIKSVAKFNGKATGIFHCFSGTLDEARQAIELGFYLGIGGVVTYKNGGLKEIVQQIGLQNLLLETDAPYLTPVPHRGKRNEPAYTQLVCLAIAEALGKSPEEVAQVTSHNAMQVFQILH